KNQPQTHKIKQKCSFLPPFALSPPACVLCRWVEADPDTCGHKLERDGICAHEFCLVSSSGQPVEELGLKGFLPEDINRTVNRATQKHCFVCGESGATITCREMSCDRSFHLPCAVDGACVTQFFFQYRSFCWEHGPRQTVEMSPEEDTTCLICLDRVGEGRSYGTMVCPVCRHAWFHRHCIQGQAVRDGITCFRCPLCRDRDVFLSEMLTMGIRVPFRLVSWLCMGSLSGQELEAQGLRPRALPDNPVLLLSLCPLSHGPFCFPRPWELLLCSSCAAEGTHRRCSSLRSSRATWECDGCAGLGTGKRQSTRLSWGWGQGPGKAWEWVPMVGLAEPLCSRRAGATCSGLSCPEPGGCALDLPASPYSLQCQLTTCRPQCCQPGTIFLQRLSTTSRQQLPDPLWAHACARPPPLAS
uniref:G2/M phase-specific E3 ubiquitin-protein ligase n=1 Tax=Calidris pygmaea TaxID=425635 RepID=A0A8C3KDP9_9CHAR